MLKFGNCFAVSGIDSHVNPALHKMVVSDNLRQSATRVKLNPKWIIQQKTLNCLSIFEWMGGKKLLQAAVRDNCTFK